MLPVVVVIGIVAVVGFGALTIVSKSHDRTLRELFDREIRRRR
jgi:hypothetical protein